MIMARVETNSAADKYYRVRLTSPKVWEKPTSLVRSLNAIPLKVGDYVYVDVTEGYNSAFILGKAFVAPSENNLPADSKDFQVLWETQDGIEWTVCAVRGKHLIIANSAGMMLTIDGTRVALEGVMPGFPNSRGPFCGIPVCPFTGTSHITNFTTGLP